MAIDKGVLEADVEVEPVTKIDVFGKSAQEIAQEIISATGEGETGKVTFSMFSNNAQQQTTDNLITNNRSLYSKD